MKETTKPSSPSAARPEGTVTGVAVKGNRPRCARQNWRRKWKRVPQDRRGSAVAALGNVFAHRRGARWILPLLLVVSLGVHAFTIPMLESNRGGEEGPDKLAASENTYLAKVEQKAKAKTVSRGLAGKITMPPPPPDPEAVVNSTLSGEISTDIQKVVGNLLDVKVANALKSQVAANLKDELNEAAKKIAEGKVSETEIKQLQDNFKKRAHEQTVKALTEHREANQVQQTKLSVTDWYENKVAATLVGKINYELFKAYSKVWYDTWNRNGWGFLADWQHGNKASGLSQLASGRHYDPHNDIGGTPTEHGQRLLPDWPKPSAKQAEAMEKIARGIYDRHPQGWAPSFNEFLAGYIDSFYPHKRQEVSQNVTGKLDGLWEKLWKDLAEYKAKAGGDESAAAAAQKACLATVKDLCDLTNQLWLGYERPAQFIQANQAIRSRLLRGEVRDRMYQRYVDKMVEVFTGPIRDLAETEFREGIIIRSAGQDQVMKEFTATVLGYLRRDIQRALPKPLFDDVIFNAYGRNPYVSKVTNESGPPSEEDIKKDEEALAKALAAWGDKEKGYVEARGQIITAQFEQAVDRVVKTLVERMTQEGRLKNDFYSSVESVDFTDKVRQRLDARARAMEGRGQDLAKLTEDGVPDTSAPMVALMLGAAKGAGVSLEPMPASMVPAYAPHGAKPASVLRVNMPRFPPSPTPWSRVTQAEPKPPFETPRAEAVPFLANFPKLDGDLTDWGRIRPLVTKKIRWITCPDEPFLIYAAWNYQGFFFGYRVNNPAEKYCYPQEQQEADPTGLTFTRPPGYGWAYRGDNIRFLFDTLDARGEIRGEPHTQEFVVWPRGTEGNPALPGIERVISSTRDARSRTGPWGELKASCKVFPPQPDSGPDGTGPYRATKFEKDGYSTEVFLPRSLFTVPVFCPGWWIGFECVVGMGSQQNHGAVYGQLWANWIWNGHGQLGDKDFPKDWGDLLLLGTDPRLAIQEADDSASLAGAIVPGHSYLVTVIDPDRNVNLSAEDTVIVSAEVVGNRSEVEDRRSKEVAGASEARPSTSDLRPSDDDVEVFVLKETGKNTATFRGYINTQPGRGRQVQGVVECSPGQEIRFGYVDIANARGDRNVVYQLRLPVVQDVMSPVGTK